MIAFNIICRNATKEYCKPRLCIKPITPLTYIHGIAKKNNSDPQNQREFGKMSHL